MTGVILATWVVARGGERIAGFPLGLGAVFDALLAALAIAAIVWLIRIHARKAAA